MPIITINTDLPRDEATQIVSADNQTQEVHIHNGERNAGRDVFIGGDNTVTDETGMHITAGETLKLELPPGDEIWAYQDEFGSHLLTALCIRRRD
jgi:hypothetical protein